MAKRVALKPDWLKTHQVTDIYSVSSCISKDFEDYINFWSHNGYWLFDSPEKIKEVSEANNLDLIGTTMFYYECYEFQSYEESPEWEVFFPESSFETNVVEPKHKTLEGFDVVSFSLGAAPECSYLSCNHMAQQLRVNQHYLLDSFDEAKNLIEQEAFVGCEPGPCRIFAVYTLDARDEHSAS